MIIKGGYEEEDIRPIIETNKLKVADIEIRMDNLKEEIRFEDRATELKRELSSDIQLFKERDTTFKKRQETIRKYIQRIRIYFDKEIQYYYITVKVSHTEQYKSLSVKWW